MKLPLLALATAVAVGAAVAETAYPPSVEEDAVRSIHVLSQERWSRLADYRALRRQVELRPEHRDGALYGYRIAELDEDGPLDGLGLRPDDVIVSVNGEPAAPPGPLALVLDYLAFPAHGSVWVEIERDGRRRVLSYLRE